MKQNLNETFENTLCPEDLFLQPHLIEQHRLSWRKAGESWKRKHPNRIEKYGKAHQLDREAHGVGSRWTK